MGLDRIRPALRVGDIGRHMGRAPRPHHWTWQPPQPHPGGLSYCRELYGHRVGADTWFVGSTRTHIGDRGIGPLQSNWTRNDRLDASPQPVTTIFIFAARMPANQQVLRGWHQRGWTDINLCGFDRDRRHPLAVTRLFGSRDDLVDLSAHLPFVFGVCCCWLHHNRIRYGTGDPLGCDRHV